MHHGGARKVWLKFAMNYFHGIVVVLLWHSHSLHQAIVAWRAGISRDATAKLEDRRRRALRGLEQAADRRIEATAAAV